MGKKIPLLISTFILTASSLSSLAVYADDEPTSWTYEEMAALNAEAQSEAEAYCTEMEDNSPMCYDMYFGSKSGKKYRALAIYRSHGLAITSINPSDRTIKIAYDTDVISAGYAEKMHVADLYIAQAKNGTSAGGFAHEIERGNYDAINNVRLLFIKNDADRDDVWFPYGTEMELSVPELSTEGDYKTSLELFYRMAPASIQWDDRFDFSECLSSLEEGMECKIMYSPSKYYYVPAKIEEPVIDIMEEVSSDADGFGAVDIARVNESKNDTTASDSLVATSVANGGDSAIKTPDTGATAGNYDDSAVEFSWWLGVIFAAGLATLAWLFWPSRKKSSKNLKK